MTEAQLLPFILGAVVIVFLVVAASLSAVLRQFVRPEWEMAAVALLTAMFWAPVALWAEGAWFWPTDVRPLLWVWLLGMDTNRPIIDWTSVVLTTLAVYALLRRWGRRRRASALPPLTIVSEDSDPPTLH